MNTPGNYTREYNRRLAAAALNQMAIQGYRTDVFLLDRYLLLEMGVILNDQQWPRSEVLRWLQSKAGPVSRSAFHRFARRFCATASSLNAMYFAGRTQDIHPLTGRVFARLKKHGLKNHLMQFHRPTLDQVISRLINATPRQELEVYRWTCEQQMITLAEFKAFARAVKTALNTRANQRPIA